MKLAKLFAELALWTAHHTEHGRAVWTERGIGPELTAHAEKSTQPVNIDWLVDASESRMRLRVTAPPGANVEKGAWQLVALDGTAELPEGSWDKSLRTGLRGQADHRVDTFTSEPWTLCGRGEPSVAERGEPSAGAPGEVSPARSPTACSASSASSVSCASTRSSATTTWRSRSSRPSSSLTRRGIAPPAGFWAEERAVRSELVRRGPGAAQSAGLGCWDEVAPVFAVGQGLLRATAAAANPIRLNIGVLTGRDPFFDHN